ncbi:TetR/AcrR family transcriptional regulator [Ferrimicrobium acidiphilum]|jgi:AcrR family transcriptional regulator|uniref:HTH-type transcriptional repressor KstR2 n=1 Tax=Ferrimicrobium acidiphilum DSM 19497 TaxID=1121877 RepID=A0A0D8FVG8_9ACTN|nr:helix-turn-helix domain-containing protein [Ferrimicrobium acidiphilum]KJE77278.1 HTH-type transcriptional repressor KstR2 [Ferrimicrobium acidiphilum DSM 19497]MCL5054233.1 TetR/AcrR family transcriptional regulator [Gammaproteobacteria bacterium]
MDQRDKGNSRRQQLTEQATEYLKTNGLASLTYRKLADELGVAPNTLEHHFGAKDQLLEQLLARLADEQRGGLQRMLSQTDVGPELFTRHFNAAMVDILNPDNEDANKLFFELVGASVRNRELYDEFLKHAMDDWIDFLCTILVDRAGIPEERSKVVAHLIMAMVRGVMLSRTMVEPKDYHLIDEAADLLGPLIESVLRDEAGPPTQSGKS